MAKAIDAFADACEQTGASSSVDRIAWLKARRSGLGGSDAAAMLGVNPYMSELALYVDKTLEGEPDDDSPEVARWGLIFEPAIIKEYSRRSGRRAVRGGQLLRSRRNPIFMCTPDGIQKRRPPRWAKGNGILQVKTTGYGQRYDEDLPVEVQIQIQWELLVTGAAWATCAWLPFPERKLAWLDVAPHLPFQETLMRRAEDFWTRIKEGRAPDPDGSESSKLALRRLFPEDNGEVIRLTEAGPIADEYERNAAAIKLLESRQSEIKNMLASTIRESKYAVLDDGRYWGSAFYAARDVRCPHCEEVIQSRGSYRTYTLRAAPKKPRKAFAHPVETRALAMPSPDEALAELVANDGEEDVA